MDNMIGKRIKQRRKELKITQSQIQQETSVSSGNLSCIENGKYLPSAPALIDLSRILDCSIDWILTGNSQISNPGISQISEFTANEHELLEGFKTLDDIDQYEILQIIKLKNQKALIQSKDVVKSSTSPNDQKDNMVG